MKNWISQKRMLRIKADVLCQEFPEKRTHIYYWYGRFFTLGLGIISGIMYFIGREDIEAFKAILLLVISFWQNLNWRRFQERYVLQLELEKNYLGKTANKYGYDESVGKHTLEPVPKTGNFEDE
jgi:hypothetical protein